MSSVRAVLWMSVALAVLVVASGMPLSAAPAVQGTGLQEGARWPGPAGSVGSQPPSPASARLAEAEPRPPVRVAGLGEPGLSFRYLQTLGTTDVPYADDATHLNGPVGVGTGGGHVWIAEGPGRRALKYATTGTFLMKIGQAGLLHTEGTVLCALHDVAVAPGGQVVVSDLCAHHVIVFDGGGNRVRELGVVWEPGSGDDRFDGPAGLAVDSAGNLFVSDSNNHRIQVFDPTGTYLQTLGVAGVPGSDNNHFDRPDHISIDSNDRLYIADSGNHRVQILDVSDLAAVAHLGTLGMAVVSGVDNAHLARPEGVAADFSRGRIAVADTGNDRVQVFNYNTLAWQATLPGYEGVSDVAVDASGTLFLAQPGSGASVVVQLDADLSVIRTYGTAGVPYLTDSVHYNQPSGVAAAADGSLCIGESAGRRLIKLDAAGVPQWTQGVAGVWGDDDSHFGAVEGVAVDWLGRVYAVDRSNCRVQVFSASGSYVATLGSGCGGGNGQFQDPMGVTVAPDGTIYVADTGNHRVQVYDHARAYVRTLGETGVPGADDGHLSSPQDVAVDAAGNLYVADRDNHRVQVFDGSGAHLGTIGQTGVAGEDFAHLNLPAAVAAGGSGWLVVADQLGQRAQVFEPSGAYLTTVGGAWGVRTGEMRRVDGVAVDGEGHLYTADTESHRVQKFVAGVPGWVQENLNGFGDLYNDRVTALAPFGDLYAGTANRSGTGAQLWRQAPDGIWSAVMLDGFGDPSNSGINHLIEFSGDLYAATWNADPVTGQSSGGQVWRSSDGSTWTQVVTQGFGDPTNGEVFRLAVFGNWLYAATWSYSEDHGTEIWRSLSGDSGSWSRVVSDGFGDKNNRLVYSFETLGGYLYATTSNQVTGTEVWRTDDGTSWDSVGSDGLGDADNWAAALSGFDGSLYAGTYNYSDSDNPGAELWHCQVCDGSDWQLAPVAKGFGNPENQAIDALFTFGDRLYAFTRNEETGWEVWCSADGSQWQQVGFAGLGDSNNVSTYYDNAVSEFLGRLYVGTANRSNGGELWTEAVTADFSATPTRGPEPLLVSFTNSSAGDYVRSEWNFGDGATSNETNPTHVYAAGVYSVTLTVGDGWSSSTRTRSSYIHALPPLRLPLLAGNLDPLLYDDFDDPAFDGAYNPALWQFWGEKLFNPRQLDGRLAFLPSGALGGAGAVLKVLHRPQRTLHDLRHFEARLQMSTDRGGGFAFARMQILSPSLAGRTWWTQCMLATIGERQPYVLCDITTLGGPGVGIEYMTEKVPAQFDRWYTIKILADSDTGALSFYLDDVLIGSHLPRDAAALKVASNLQAQIGVWNDEPNGFIARYFDDVRITGGRH